MFLVRIQAGENGPEKRKKEIFSSLIIWTFFPILSLKTYVISGWQKNVVTGGRKDDTVRYSLVQFIGYGRMLGERLTPKKSAVYV